MSAVPKSDAVESLVPLTHQAGVFCATLDVASVPAAIVDKARLCIFYGFGIGVVCLPEVTAAVAAEAAQALDGAAGTAGATALVNGQRLAPSAAAFANAVLLHARCQEDTSGTAHLGVSILASALALIEAGLGRPDRMLEAVIAGYEVGGALERLLGQDSMKAGFRASPLYGTIAAAATAARLLGLPAERIGAALGNAAAFTGGTLQSIPEGSDEWRYQVGVATRNGLQAALLARAGSQSTRYGLEGAQGLARSFARRAFEPAELELGTHWNLPAVTFKPYPVCAHNQTPAALGVALSARLQPEQISSLCIRINPYVVPGMLERGPFTRVAETLMSTYFCVASALVHGSVTMTSLAAYGDPAIAGLIARTRVELDAALPFPSAAADVVTQSGERFTLTEMRRFQDYSLTRDEVQKQLGRLAAESAIPAGCMDALESFAYGLPSGDAQPVLQAFEHARAALRHRDG